MQLSSSLTTILLTDIEGSTRLWEQEGERMSGALAAHDALVRNAVEGFRGIVVKMIGDGVYATFDDPQDALEAALQIQRGLVDPAATNGIKLVVRSALHSGMVERRDNDYFGSAVNRAARITRAAHGGQILLSQAVVDQIATRLPTQVTLLDLGTVRLRDLSTPEHVYQVVHPEFRQAFPALRSLESTPNNLPQQLTSFIGRERELGEAKALLESSRLVTLLGMGGLGKTRLSMQIGADSMDRFPDGVWFIDLAPIVDPALVPATAAQVLGVREEPGKPITQTICAHHRQHKLLLILDNCEHLMGACASFADALLRGAPEVRIIATSREALRIPGEQTYPVYPLAVPDRAAGVEALQKSEAVQLFMERARLQKPGFELTEKDAPAIAELCARLEGIPLALELAAARVRSLSVQDINKRLHDRFKLLTGGSRVALERQQTLRALVAWSYDMLPESEQLLLERLSAFAGGFDLAAAETICGGDPLTPEDVLDLLTSLVEKSLVIVEEGDDESRYRQLETIREFAREYLDRREDAAATRAAHCDYYFALAKTAKPHLQGAEQATWIRRLEVETGNLRSAIALALAGGVDTAIAVKLEVALMRFRILRGYATEGRNNLRLALALPTVQKQAPAHGHALYLAGVLAAIQSDYGEAKRLLTECLALRRNFATPSDIAATLSTLSNIHLNEGDANRARDAEVEALEIFRTLDDKIGEGIGLSHLGEIHVNLGDPAEALTYFEKSLAIARAMKYRELEAECERNLGELAFDAGDLKASRTRLERSLSVCRDAEDKRGEASALWWLGRVDAETGDHDAARANLTTALRAFQAFEMNAETLECLEDLATQLQATGFAGDALHLYAAADAARERLMLVRPPRSEKRWHNQLGSLRSVLGEGGYEIAWSDGQAWGLNEAIRYCLAGASRPVGTTAPVVSARPALPATRVSA